jgi:hypothetical protein
MPQKQKMSKHARAEFCAGLVVKAAHDFNHLGVGWDELGIPPRTASPSTCKGHGLHDFCVVCNFNRCHECGSCSVHPGAFWAGCCGGCGGVGSAVETERAKKHFNRVLALIGAADMMPPKVVVEEQAPLRAKKTKKVSPAVKKTSAAQKPVKKSVKKTAAAAALLLDALMVEGVTSAKVVRNKKIKGWTLKLSIDLKPGSAV